MDGVKEPLTQGMRVRVVLKGSEAFNGAFGTLLRVREDGRHGVVLLEQPVGAVDRMTEELRNLEAA